MSGRTILLVEDDAEMRRTLAGALESHEIRVSIAADGIEALERLRSGPPPSVVLLDLRLPRLAGEEVLREMRKDPRYENVPVITMTAGVDGTPDHEVVVRLHKPFDVSALLEILLSLFEASAA